MIHCAETWGTIIWLKITDTWAACFVCPRMLLIDCECDNYIHQPQLTNIQFVERSSNGRKKQTPGSRIFREPWCLQAGQQ